MDKFEVLKQIYDTTENKDEFLGQFDEAIRAQVKECLDKGDAGLYEQLSNPTSLSEGTSAAVDTPVIPELPSQENTCVEEVTLPEGDVVNEALQDVIQMDTDIHSATGEVIEALPEAIQEGAEIWKDASQDMSMEIIRRTYARLAGTDFSEADVLIQGCDVAKDLVNEGWGKTSLNRAMEEIDTHLSNGALENLYTVREELKGLRDSVEEVVDYISEEDNLGLTPSAKAKLVDIILDDGIFTDDSDHDVREDIKEVVESSGDYSAMDASVKEKLVNDFCGYEFSMECANPLTVEALAKAGNYHDAVAAVEDAINFLCESEGRYPVDNCGSMDASDSDFADKYDAESVKHHEKGQTDRTRLQEQGLTDRAETEQKGQTKRTKSDNKAKVEMHRLDNEVRLAELESNTRMAQSKYENSIFGAVGKWAANRGNKPQDSDDVKKARIAAKQEDKQRAHELEMQKLANETAFGRWRRVRNERKLAKEKQDADIKLQKIKEANRAKEAQQRQETTKEIVGSVSNAYSNYAANSAYKKAYNNMIKNPYAMGANVTYAGNPRSGMGAKIALGALAAAGAGVGAYGMMKAKNAKKDHSRSDFSDFDEGQENVVSDQILMADETVESLAAKYASLPTIESKTQMEQDMIEAGLPQEYIDAITGRANGEFSEEEMPVDPQAVKDVVEEFGPSEIAGPDETVTTDEFDGILPPGEVMEEGVSLEERITPEDLVGEGEVADDSFESII